MALDRILLTTFRNHRETTLEGTTRFNLLVGDNGAGKTNVLEALSLFAPGRGLRRAQLADMAAQGGPGGFAVSADLAAESGPVRLGTGIAPERPCRRIVHVNQADAPAVRLGEWLSIGWLTPAMDRLFMEGAGTRRRFMDRLVLALDPGHARQAEGVGEQLQELALGRGLGQLPGQRIARIGERVIDQVFLLAAPGHADLDFVAALGA